MKSLILSTKGHLLGSRHFALPVRDELVGLINSGEKVEIDFADTNPTQSYIDELIGVLVMDFGKVILSKLIFKNCSETTQALLHLVVSDRLKQASQTNIEEEQCV